MAILHNILLALRLNKKAKKRQLLDPSKVKKTKAIKEELTNDSNKIDKISRNDNNIPDIKKSKYEKPKSVSFTAEIDRSNGQLAALHLFVNGKSYDFSKFMKPTVIKLQGNIINGSISKKNNAKQKVKSKFGVTK